MDNHEGRVTTPPTSEPGVSATGDELPPGDHPLEIAARKGIGPLSPACRAVWHGDSVPCVSCGQLVPRSAESCDECGQDLSDLMLAKMRAHAGPWYVLEHVRPFPGVTLDRIVRQIRRGLITETSIIRGPATEYHWRFAVETPGICRYFNRCWNCHEQVTASDSFCQSCLSQLAFEPASGAAESQGGGRSGSPVPIGTRPSGVDRAPPRPAPSTVPVARPARRQSVQELAAALNEVDLPAHDAHQDAPPRIAGMSATWIAAALLLLVLLGLWMMSQLRSRQTNPLFAPSAPPAMIAHPSLSVFKRCFDGL